MTPLRLRDFHSRLNARFAERYSVEVVENYSDPDLEYRALTQSCGLLDLGYRSRLVLLGADRHKFLNGQVTNNIKDLGAWRGCYAAMVTAKAKIVTDLHVFALNQELLLEMEPGMTAPIAERLEKFIVADDVQIVDAAPHYELLSVQGPKAPAVIASLEWAASVPTEELAIVGMEDSPWGAVYLANRPRTGSAGFDLHVPVLHGQAAAEALRIAAEAVGGRTAGWSALECARIEAGIPRFGIDMDESILAPEAGIAERAICYTKGCYSGQEVIARIRTYGQVSKSLRGLALTGLDGELPPARTRLYKAGRDVGFLTSTAFSPRRGEPVALGYVRRECNGPGETLEVGTSESKVRATVVPLPFAGPLLAGN